MVPVAVGVLPSFWSPSHSFQCPSYSWGVFPLCFFSTWYPLQVYPFLCSCFYFYFCSQPNSFELFSLQNIEHTHDMIVNKNINKMNMVSLSSGGEQLFDDSGEIDTDEAALEEETHQLLNQVFNQKYKPVYDPKKTKAREEQYRKVKQQQNRKRLKREEKKGPPILYSQHSAYPQSASFTQFLMRAQQRINSHYYWVEHEQKKQEEVEQNTIQITPAILKRSREKIGAPLYERCLDVQREKEDKLEKRRIEKNRKQAHKESQYSYRPVTNEAHTPKRNFKQYLAEKELWQRNKDESLQRKRVETEVSRLSECTFTPTLVSNYSRPISSVVPGERVEQRLLRSLQKSLSSSRKH